jgi:hypothetical protein
MRFSLFERDFVVQSARRKVLDLTGVGRERAGEEKSPRRADFLAVAANALHR